MTNQKRYAEIDLLRALSIVGMIVFHTFFVLSYFGVLSLNMNEGAWELLGNAVRFSFLGLVGVALVLSKQRQQSSSKFITRQLRRTIKIGCVALTVSLATYLFEPAEFVRFGILHLITVGIFIGAFLAGQKYTSFLLGTLVLLMTDSVTGLQINSFFFYVLGADPGITPALDYFPVFPWLAVVLFGITLGGLIYKEGNQPLIFQKVPSNYFIKFLSRHSLSIYLLHVPIILGILILAQVIPLTKILAISESLANIV